MNASKDNFNHGLSLVFLSFLDGNEFEKSCGDCRCVDGDRPQHSESGLNLVQILTVVRLAVIRMLTSAFKGKEATRRRRSGGACGDIVG